jgi:hypothetical protein
MKVYEIIFALIFIMPSIASSQILVDTSFINNTEKWSVKGESTFPWNLSKPTFGPFATIDINKEKKEREKLGKSTSLMGESGTFGLMKTVDRKVVQPIRITALFNNTDSMFIDLSMVSISTVTKGMIQLGKNKQPDKGSLITYAEETFIRTKADTSHWYMASLPNQLISPGFQDYSDEKTVLRNYPDSFEIRSARGFPIKGKIRKEGLLWASSGFAFLTGNKQVAVVQTAPEMNVWIKNDLTETFKQIIGSAILSIISTRR